MKRLLNRLHWYKNRLAAMSACEIFYRLQEAVRRKTDENRTENFVASPRDFGVLPEIPGLCAGLDVWHVPEILMAQWTEDAAKARRREFCFFGQEWPACSPANIWRLDPQSGILWPKDAFCFSIDYRHSEQKGDIKYVWELNRLQYLQPLAALARKTQNVDLAHFCLEQIDSWIDQNPPFHGVNWNSGIELALRAVSILTVTSLVGAHLTREKRSKIWASLHTHALWIARYPSRYSSANNHRTAEGLGLFMIGTLCPHFAEASLWKETGWNILCDAAEHQILPDGAGAEQAIAYAASVLETLLLGWKIAKTYNLPIPEHFMRKLTLAGEYIRWFSDAHGGYPYIGDDDNACVIGMHHSSDTYATNVLASLAAVTGRADLTPEKIQPHLRQAIFGFPLHADFIPYGTRCFPHGGMTIGRHKSAQGDVMLGFDHGYLGYLSIAAHGHADTLSLWLHIGGQPVFVDAGTYLYHSQHEWRKHFRGTAAHNTLLMENTDSSVMAGNFNWSHKAKATLRRFEICGDFWQAEAEHDGYVEKFQSRHRRSVHVSSVSGAVIEDTLMAPEPHLVDIRFLLHPKLTARRDGSEIAILKGEQLVLRVRHEGPLETHIGLPDTPTGGWYSSEFGLKQATTCLSFRGLLIPTRKVITHLFWSA